MTPGELLRILLDERGLTQKELARLRLRPVQAINEIVRGKKRITSEMAVELEHELGLPAEVWLAFESTQALRAVRVGMNKRHRANLRAKEERTMGTVTREEFIRDAAAVMRRSETEGPIGITGDDGKIHSVVHAPRDERHDCSVCGAPEKGQREAGDMTHERAEKWLRSRYQDPPHPNHILGNTIQR